MFLHCVAVNRAEVAVSWNEFSREGNSLFWFRLGLGLISMIAMVPLLILGGLKVFHMAMDQSWSFQGVATVVGFGLTLFLLAIVFGIIRKVTTDFVVPIMRLRRMRCLAGWRWPAAFSQIILASCCSISCSRSSSALPFSSSCWPPWW